MLQAEYKRNLQNNYMVIEAEEEPEESYCLHMAENNQIPGLLSFHSTRTDGRLYIQYEITSRQPMNQMYAKKILSGNQLNRILKEIYEMLEAVQGYLLNPAQILFDPQYIYVSAEDRTLQFCYLPGKERTETIQILAEFFLKHLDHEDFRAVETGYLFYQCVQEENFSLKQTLKKLLHGDKDAAAEHTDTENHTWNHTSEKEYIPSEYEDGTEERYQDLGKKRNTDEWKKEKENEEWKESYKDMYDVYKVTHKERKKESVKSRTDQLFQIIHPAVLISALLLLAVIEILYYFRLISLTEAGGMFFLLISMEILGNQIWKKRQQKEEEREFRWISEEEEAMYRILQEEMYDDKTRSGKNEDNWSDAISERDPGETRYLGEREPELRLIPVVGKEFGNRKSGYPEIIMRKEPLLIGKRKGESDIILDSPTVSRTHAMLERKGGMYYLCDLNSKNGTFCNGERLMPQEKRNITQDDLISFAELEYRAVIYSSADSA